MSVNWPNELQVLDRVGPSRDLWADALARAESRRPPTCRGFRWLSWLPSWRRGTVVLAATALGIAGLAAAGVVALTSSNAAAAYAVTTHPDGTITIKLRQFSALPALNRELAQEGLPLKAVPMTAHCAFNPVPRLPRGFIPFIPSDQALGRRLRPTDSITIGTSGLSEGTVGVIGVGRTTSGGLSLVDAGARSPGPSCINSAAFNSPEVRVTPLTVSRGEHETLVAWVRHRPVPRCTITVWDKNGSHAQGLLPKRPVHGRVSWTWRVGTNTNLGKHRIIVRCGEAGSFRTLFRVAR